MEFHEYEALAATTKISDIISATPASFPDGDRASILEKLRGNDPTFTDMLVNYPDPDLSENGDNYVPVAAHDLGWLGYFIGKNTQLKILYISELMELLGAETSSDQVEAFCKCVSLNETIEELHLCGMGRVENNRFRSQMMEPLFANLERLTTLEVDNCTFGPQEVSVFSSAKRVTSMTLGNTRMGTETLAELFCALSMLPMLNHVSLKHIDAGMNVCTEVAAFLRKNVHKLLRLDLYHIGIDDEGFEALVPDLANCMLTELQISCERSISARGWQHLSALLDNQQSKLVSLDLSDNNIGDEELETCAPALLSSNLLKLTLDGNEGITTRGWRALSALLEDPDFNLEQLHIAGTVFNDQDALLFSNALCNNRRLKVFDIGSLATNGAISSTGWAAFCRLLWGDVSSVNDIYLANHTLCSFGTNFARAPTPYEVGLPLSLNYDTNKKKVATTKILARHGHFLDMHQLFEWEFKTLPIVIDWFDRAATYVMDIGGGIETVKRRKLCVIYQFIRGMPIEYIELRERMDKERFLMFTRVLMKYLEQRDSKMHAKAKAVIKECYEKNKSGDPNFRSLTNSMKAHLRVKVGELYWTKARQYLEHYLKQKKEQKYGASQVQQIRGHQPAPNNENVPEEESRSKEARG